MATKEEVEWFTNAIGQPDLKIDASENVITAAKIVLESIGEKLTDRNIQATIEFMREEQSAHIDITRMTDSDRRKLKKHLRKELNRNRRLDRELSNEEFKLLQQSQPLTDLKGSGSHVIDPAYQGVIKQREKEGQYVNYVDPADLPDLGKQFQDTLKPLAHAKAYQDKSFGEVYDGDLRDIARHLENGLILEKPQGTSFHHLVDFITSLPGREATLFNFMRQEFQSFVVEHDWAKAFEGVKDFEGGDIMLPYEFTCFEFRISGLRVMACLGTTPNGIEGVMITGINKRWYVNPHKLVLINGQLGHLDVTFTHTDRFAKAFLDLLGKQIRAVCIMLDAKVAVGERRNLAVGGLNKKRIKEGKAPLRDYHVVVLSKRLRSEGSRDSEPTGVHRRLHWRRGHWRHFDTPGGAVRYINNDGITVSKTWINWQLVGDEMLGFVDKHYKL
jgi:hypothetical protein